MVTDHCYGVICFIALDANAPKFFGFSEFLASLALMVLAWTTADSRYKFRINTAPIPLRKITFWVVAFTGITTLLTDLWRYQSWPVIAGEILTPQIWQAILGLVFLLTFLVWAWFAFISPPIFSSSNCKQYANALYKVILNGSASELDVIADEVNASASSIVKFATNRSKIDHLNGRSIKPTEVEQFANEILLLIGNRRFCRSVVSHAQGTALLFFNSVQKQGKYGIDIGVFGQNLIAEALEDRDSFLFHEINWYESGLIGEIKPLSSAIFSNFELVESVNTLLDVDFKKHQNWDSSQWDAYSRMALLTYTDYIQREFYQHSTTLARARGVIKQAANNIYKLNDVTEFAWNNNSLDNLRVVTKFITSLIKILEKINPPDNLKIRKKNRQSLRHETVYDHVATMLFEVLCEASKVQKPRETCWWIQHNTVWSDLFLFMNFDHISAKIILLKLRRMIYEEIITLDKFSNYRAAKLAGLLINILGFTPNKKERNFYGLHLWLLRWIRKNFSHLSTRNPELANSILVSDISFDAANSHLIKTYPSTSFRIKPHLIYFNIDK